jgi:hypothetical protein
MSRWFRHYAGMMRDEKLVRVALKSKQPIERVIWVWGAILESAAEIDDEGRYDLDEAEAAYFLRADEADVRAIAASLADGGRIAEGRVVKWGDRQFKSDNSAERVRLHRAKRKGDGNGHDGRQSEVTEDRGNDPVTLRSRSGNAPETETETETETEKSAQARPSADDTVQQIDTWLRSLVGSEPVCADPNTEPVRRLLTEGYTVDDIETGIRAAMDDPGFRPKWWKSLVGWITHARRDRLGNLPKSRAPPAEKPKRSDEMWRQFVRIWKDGGEWLVRESMEPDRPDTLVPRHVLAEFGLVKEEAA